MKLPSSRTSLVFVAGFVTCILLVFGTLAGGYYFWLKPQMDKMTKVNLKAPPLPSAEKVDLDLQFRSLDNKEYSLNDFLGKTVVLNFWATWCAPCVAELPSLTKLSYKYAKDSRVAIICLSDESIQTIKSKEIIDGLKAPIFSFEGHKAPKVFQKGMIPATFIISPEGRIAFTHVGTAQWDDSSVISFIDNLTQSTEQGAAANP